MFARLMSALAKHPLMGLQLITHKVHERDRAWFDTCKLTHLHAAPGARFELTRACLLPLCAGIDAGWFLAVWFGHFVVILIAHNRLTGQWRKGVDPAKHLANWQRYIVGRALVCVLVNAAALAIVPSDHLVPLVIFLLAADAMVLFAHFTLPVAGLVSSWISTLGMAVALLMRPDVPALPTLLLMLLLMSSAHIRVFNLHYMFATRRLRTRELRTANDTIELLLTQYREHGSDCLVEVDSEGLIVAPSPQLCRLLGEEADTLVGAKLLRLFDPGPGPEAIRAAARRLQSFHEVSLSRAIAGRARWFVMSGCALLDGEGRHSGFRGFLRDVTDRHEAESTVRFLAHHDPLTRLVNRAEFHGRLAHALAGCGPGPIACLFVDLEHFNPGNDSRGHSAGDRRPQAVADPALNHH